MVEHGPVAARFSATAARFLDLVTAPDLATRDRLEVLRALVPLLGELLAGLVELPEVSEEALQLGQP